MGRGLPRQVAGGHTTIFRSGDRPCKSEMSYELFILFEKLYGAQGVFNDLKKGYGLYKYSEGCQVIVAVQSATEVSYTQEVGDKKCRS